MSPQIVFYPGSFDPFTYGHLDILVRTAKSFDKIIVGVLENISKKPLFSLEERKSMIEDVIKSYNLSNVVVESYKGLAVDFMQKHSIKIMIRGIRVISDFENEMRIAFHNKDLYPSMETFFLFTSPAYGHVSSSTVKEIYFLGGDITRYVPEKILRCIEKFERLET